MVRSFKIRDIEIAPGLVLAPMSGVTTSAFRRLIKELNPGAVGYTISEFVSVEGMTRGSRRTPQMLKFREMERPFGIQIFGYDIARMRDAAMMVEQAGADIIDINCGCPAPKVVKRGGGAELMRQPDHLKEIFAAVRKAVSIPLTMKMRSGWDSESQNCVEIARMAESEGVEGITVHGRTRVQLYRGQADWSFVERVAEAVAIPVCGSGDISASEHASLRLSAPKVAGLYIGRAAMSNPYVFSEICGLRAAQRHLDAAEVVRITERYIELLREDFSPKASIGKVKQLVSQMGRGHGWRKTILRAMTLEAQVEFLSRVREMIESGGNPAGLDREGPGAQQFAEQLAGQSLDAEQTERGDFPPA